MRNKRFILIVGALIASLLAAFAVFFYVTASVFDVSCLNLDNDNERMSCWYGQVEKLVEEGETKQAIDLIAEIMKTDTDFVSGCHAYMHEIGQGAYLQFNEGKDFSVSENITLCTYGFYHGFLETLITTTGGYSEAREFCAYIDTQLSKSGVNKDNLRGHCYHGIGHGAIDDHQRLSSSTPSVAAKKTLEVCRDVTDSDSDYMNCAGGVFNGIAVAIARSELGWKMDVQDPMRLCREYEGEEARTCYSYFAYDLFYASDRDVLRAFAKVNSTVAPNFRKDVISNVAQINASRIPEEVDASFCTSVKGYEKACTEGMARGIVQSGGASLPATQILRVCFDPNISPQTSKDCISMGVHEAGRWYSEEAVSDFCKTLKSEKGVECSTLSI